MSLEHCSDCNHEISKKALSCPNCGAAKSLELRIKSHLQILAAILVPVIGVVFTWNQHQSDIRLERDRKVSIESREKAALATKLLDSLASDEERKRKISTSLALCFASVNQLHEGVIPALMHAANDDNEYAEQLRMALLDMQSENKGDGLQRAIGKALSILDTQNVIESTASPEVRDDIAKEALTYAERANWHLAVPAIEGVLRSKELPNYRMRSLQNFQRILNETSVSNGEEAIATERKVAEVVRDVLTPEERDLFFEEAETSKPRFVSVIHFDNQQKIADLIVAWGTGLDYISTIDDVRHLEQLPMLPEAHELRYCSDTEDGQRKAEGIKGHLEDMLGLVIELKPLPRPHIAINEYEFWHAKDPLFERDNYENKLTNKDND